VLYVLAAVLILLAGVFLWWQFEWSFTWLLAVAVPLSYLFLCGHRKNRAISVAEAIILGFCIVLIGLGPRAVKSELRAWSNHFKTRIKGGAPFEVKVFGCSLTMGGTPGDPGECKDLRVVPVATKLPAEAEESLSQRQPLNLIRNGDFLLPLTSLLSSWGHGQYTDQLRARFQKPDIIWINFRDADIDVQIAQTEVGPALRIENRNALVDGKRVEHRIGIMEQYVRCEPGEYRLSLTARGRDVEASALFCATTDDWEPFKAQKTPLIRQRLDLPNKSGSFSWKHFERTVQLDGGERTFTIVSQGRGILYLTDISLVRIAK
jgi:hypothetical protein